MSMMTASGKRLVSVKEACEILNISKTTLYLLFKENKLRRVKVHDRTLILESSLDEYMDSLLETA